MVFSGNKDNAEVKTFLGRWIFLVIFLAVSFVIAKMIGPFFPAIFVGILFTMISLPLHKRLRLKFSKIISAALTSLAVFFLVITPFFIFFYFAVSQAVEIGQGFYGDHGGSVQGLLNQLKEYVDKLPFVGGRIDLLQINNYLKQGASIFAATSLDLLKSIPSFALQSVIAGICFFFFLADGPSFLAEFYKKTPIKDELLAKVLKAFSDTANSMLIANLWACSAQAVIVSIGFAALQIPMAFLAGGLTFILAWIPLVGSVPVSILGVIYLLTQGLFGKAILMVVVGLLASSIDNFIRPFVLSGKSEMHPLVGLIAIFGGLEVFGFIGIFLGPAMVAAFSSLLEIWPEVYEKDSTVKIHGPNDMTNS